MNSDTSRDVLSPDEWEIAFTGVEREPLPLKGQVAYRTKAEVVRKNGMPFTLDEIIGKQILAAGHLFTIEYSRLKLFLAPSGLISTSAFITCSLLVDCDSQSNDTTEPAKSAEKIDRKRLVRSLRWQLQRIPGQGADPAYVAIWLERERNSLINNILTLLNGEEQS